jgi:hypothetical protein
MDKQDCNLFMPALNQLGIRKTSVLQDIAQCSHVELTEFSDVLTHRPDDVGSMHF